MSDANAKELLAKKKRAEALKHLEAHGQKVSVNGTMMGSTVQATTDNTLQLIRKQEALRKSAQKASSEQATAAQAVQSSTSTSTSTTTKAAAEEKSATTCPPLPAGWQEVLDATTKQTYFWNTISNETTWVRPSSSAAPPPPPPPPPPAVPSSPALPAGWEERTHPATRQTYYYNSATGKSSFTLPALETPPHASTTSSSQDQRQGAGGKGACTSGDEAEKTKKRKLGHEEVSVHSKVR